MKGAQELVGTSIDAGCTVTAKGRSKAIATGGVAGAALGSAAQVAGQMQGARSGDGASPLPTGAASLGYLAVTADEVVLCQAKQGLVSPKAVGVLARAARAEVTGAVLGDGTLQRPLTITFANGVTWEFEIPRVQVKGAEQVLGVLG